MTWITQNRWIEGQLVADMQQAQWLMVAGFIMLGWVLARRQIKLRGQINRDAREANQAIKRIREHQDRPVPLCDAPAETQRWQVALFDLQRELKADLDTRIAVVQTLLRQVDQRIERLTALDSSTHRFASSSAALSEEHHRTVQELLRRGHTANEIAVTTGLPVGDVELTISTIRPDEGS